MGITNMMKQYLEIKETCKDTLLLFRLGDFYEMFFDDAIVASRELELTLTGRDCGLPERAPMCGVPHHALDGYLSKLIQKGYKVAICEQLTPPNKKELVKREITRIVTPGTVTESNMLTENKNNFIASVCYRNGGVGIAWADISTGEFNHTFIDGQIAVKLNDLLARIDPAEIICNEEMLAESINLSTVKYGEVCPFSTYNETEYDFDTAKKVLKDNLSDYDIKSIPNEQSVCAAGALLSYVQNMQKCKMTNIGSLQKDESDKYMIIDANARRVLELNQSLSNGKEKGSLFWCVDKTKTGMGARMLKKWIEKPELSVETIGKRLDTVEELVKRSVDCGKLQTLLDSMYDIERLTARLTCQKITPTEFLALSKSLRAVPGIKRILSGFNSALTAEINDRLTEFTEDCDLIDSAMYDRNAAHPEEEDNEESDEGKNKPTKKDKGKDKNRIFNAGYDQTLDEYRDLIYNTHSVLAKLLAREKEETGIKNLKLGFNNVFGYYLEVSKSQVDLVPYRYVRKQTIVNGERYVTEELKELEEKILTAQSSSESRETELYKSFIEHFSKRISEYQVVAKSVAILDCLVSFAYVARENDYVKPIINDGKSIVIREGRHASVERLLHNEAFVPNDTQLDSDENRIMLITGPNMAGKSIYMKQVALIVIMAQMGCFVPAAYAEIGVVDRIFTRVGASDDLMTGRSTFMVEMSEVSNILENATDNSLLLMDEIGRGTSTFDGLSIAWAIIEYLSEKLCAKVLFSTHYHELTDLENTLKGLKNYKLTVRELGNSIVFLRKLMRGSANRSFGIEVAGLSGLPDKVVYRAKEILKKLETSDLRNSAMSQPNNRQMSLFVPEGKSHEITKILRELDVDNVTPRGALDILIDLKEKAEEK